jgi:hypothetical protein
MIRSTRDIQEGIDNFLVIPTGGKLGLAGIACAVSVTAAAVCLPVEYVPATFGADADVVDGRAIPLVYRVPAGSFGSRIGNVRAVSRAVPFRLVVSQLVVNCAAVIRLVVTRLVVTRLVVTRLVVTRHVVTRLVVTRAVLSRLLAVRPVIGRAERLVVLLATSRFDRLRRRRRLVTTRSVGPKVLFEPGLTRLEVVVRPV